MVPVSAIKPDPNQPRKIFSEEGISQLTESIKKHGIIKNIEIDKNFTIISGENRWRAAKAAGLKEIPCRIMNLQEPVRQERQLHENIHHIPMNPMDVARALKTIADTNPGLSSVDIAKLFGKSKSWVIDNMRALKMSTFLQEKIQSGEVTYGHLHHIHPVEKLENAGTLPKGTMKKVLHMLKTSKSSVNNIKPILIAISSHPDKVEQILALDIKGKGSSEISTMVWDIAPPTSKRAADATRQQTAFLFEVKKMRKSVVRFKFNILGIRRSVIKEELKLLEQDISHWLKNSKE